MKLRIIKKSTVSDNGNYSALSFIIQRQKKFLWWSWWVDVFDENNSYPLGFNSYEDALVAKNRFLEKGLPGTLNEEIVKEDNTSFVIKKK